MKQLYVDRFEGKYVICEDADHRYYAIEVGEAPQGVRSGDVLTISDEGELAIDTDETARRRAAMSRKQRQAFGEDE